MNPNKVCFILCANHEQYVEECLHYLRRLEIPEGMETEIQVLREQPSMAAGYNLGMRSTDARYKVYLHQDVFLLNAHFIRDIRKIFEDPEVGMLGMIGNPTIPKDGVPWRSDRVGRLYMCTVLSGGEAETEIPPERPYREVACIDGLLMATQYDIPWREDIFAGWDYYDLSQSLEFQRAGYKVVVPYMETPWCLHCDDILNLKDYFHWKQVFLDTYHKEIFGESS